MIEANEVTRHFQATEAIHGPPSSQGGISNDNEWIRAVDSATFRIDKGERVAVVGTSGSGKSTLLNLMSGLDRPTSGQLTVHDRQLHRLSRSEMAQYRLTDIGIVFQSFQLIPQRTALQNIELPLIMARVDRKERTELCEQWLGRVGLLARRNHYPYQMSGGEQQRVAIARSLVNSPRVLLADEPTGNLDRANATAIMELLLELAEQSDLTLVLVTHDESLATTYCQRRLVMSDGKIRDAGTDGGFDNDQS